MPRILAVLIIAVVVLTACGSGKPTRAATEAPEAPQDVPTAAAIPQRTAAGPDGEPSCRRPSAPVAHRGRPAAAARLGQREQSALSRRPGAPG